MLCCSPPLPLTVVTSKELKRHHDVWVCPSSDDVCTRFFFVYNMHAKDFASAQDLDTRTVEFKKEIDHAVAHIQAIQMCR